MQQKPVEIILMRQLAKTLAMPIVLFDAEGRVLFFNTPAERMIGRRFEDTGEISLEDWYASFDMFDNDGSPLALEDRPVVIALRKRHAAHATYWAMRSGGTRVRVEATAFPLEGQGGRHLGVVAAFWEPKTP